MANKFKKIVCRGKFLIPPLQKNNGPSLTELVGLVCLLIHVCLSSVQRRYPTGLTLCAGPLSCCYTASYPGWIITGISASSPGLHALCERTELNRATSQRLGTENDSAFPISLTGDVVPEDDWERGCRNMFVTREDEASSPGLLLTCQGYARHTSE